MHFLVYPRVRRAQGGVVLPWWVVIALCSDSRVQSLHCAVTAAGAAGGFGVGATADSGIVAGGGWLWWCVCAGGLVFNVFLPCFYTCIRTWRDLVFAQVDTEDAADGHDAVEEGAVVGCGGGNGDAASLSRGS